MPGLGQLLCDSLREMRGRGEPRPGNRYERMARMVELLRPGDWTALVEAVCFASGTYARLGECPPEDLARRIRQSPFRHVLYCREALQEYLESRGASAILAWQMTRQLSSGRNGWESELFTERTPDLAEDELFLSVDYLWSRTHAVEWIRRHL